MNAVNLSVAISVADVRREPDPDSELVTQALLNEPVYLRADFVRKGNWSRIELSDYSGWMRSDEIGEPPASGRCKVPDNSIPAEDPFAVLRVPFAPLYVGPEDDEVLATLYLSTALPLLDISRKDRYQVGLPNGRTGWLARQTLALRDEGMIYPPEPVSVATAYARSFLNVPYLWGGRSWRGIDCSALVQLCYRMAGSILPRDADQQYAALGPDEITPEKMREGDLVFFGHRRITHVALALDHKTFIHAEGQRFQRVIIHSLDPSDARFDQHLADLVYSIKRIEQKRATDDADR